MSVFYKYKDYSNIDECEKQMAVGFATFSTKGFNAMKKVALEILSNAQKNLKKNKTTAFGQLSASGSVYADKVTREVDVGFTAVHAPFVEFGRKAGRMPPLKPLEAWVRRKIRVVSKTKTGKVRTNKNGEVAMRKTKEGDEIESIALAIARKIKHHGTKAQPFLRPAYEAASKKIEEIMKMEVKA